MSTSYAKGVGMGRDKDTMRVVQLLVPQVPRNPMTETSRITPPIAPMIVPAVLRPSAQPDLEGTVNAIPKASRIPEAA